MQYFEAITVSRTQPQRSGVTSTSIVEISIQSLSPFTLLVSAMAASSHAARLSLSLSLLTSSDKPDMSLVSLEGFHLPTYSILLSLHSPYLRSLLSLSSSSLSSSSSLAISVPLPAQPIASLLNLLVTGDSKQQQSFDPIQVTRHIDQII